MSPLIRNSLRASGCAAFLAAAACGDDAEPFTPIISLTRAATATECPNGGTAIDSGADANENSTLDGDEITSTELVCSPSQGAQGEDGRSALVRTSAEPAGANCPDGGSRVESGVDDDGDGQLGDAEVDQTLFICNQATGEDGLNFLVRTSSATAEQCEQGGILVESGVDADASGALDDPEVRFTQVVCAGAEGFDRRIEFAEEPRGPNCAAGGQRVSQGLDANRDGILQAGEIDEVTFICAPAISLVRTSTLAPGAECPNGGLVLERGLDADGDEVLSDPEVLETIIFCTGEDGLAGLVRTSTIPAGADCANGGTRIESGDDDDGNGVLDPAEVDAVSFACNEDPGSDGRPNAAVNITPEPAGPNCALGGTRIETGPDDDENGQLDPSEVVNTTFICDQADGLQTLVTTTEELPGPNCLNGGQRIESGIDINADGVLQANEVTETRFVCSAVPVVPVAITTPANLGTVFVNDDLSSIEIEGIGGLGGGYQWSIQNGPAGIGIDPTGTPTANLTGTSTVPGAVSFDVILFDANGAVASRTFDLTFSLPPCGPGQSGAVGETFSAITVTGTNFSGSVRGMAADDDVGGWVYYVEPGIGFNRFRKNGTVRENDLETQIAGLGTGDIGYEMDIDGQNIYLTSDDTACTSLCVYRVSSDGGATLSLQDVGDFTNLTTNDDLRGIHVNGNTMYVITHDIADTQLYSIDLSGTLPAVPTLLATFGDIEYCSGLEGDDNFLYTVCDDVDGGTDEGVVRIDPIGLTAETVLLTPTFFTVGTDIISAVYGEDLDNDGRFDILYVTGDSGDDLYLCDVGAATLSTSIFNREWLTAFSGDDEGMAFDRSNKALYKVDESSANAAQFQ